MDNESKQAEPHEPIIDALDILFAIGLIAFVVSVSRLWSWEWAALAVGLLFMALPFFVAVLDLHEQKQLAITAQPPRIEVPEVRAGAGRDNG